MILGITGGVGCGKTTVLNYLKKKYDAYIIEADKVAYELSQPGNEGYNKILKEFPELTILEDGSFDRKQMASIVFNDDNKLKKLNNIIHPLVKKEILNLLEMNKNHKIIVIEAALLIEEGYDSICDELWYIYCDIDSRIKRLYESRNYSREKSLDIIENQLSEEEYRNNTKCTIDNSMSISETEKQIDELLLNNAMYSGKI